MWKPFVFKNKNYLFKCSQDEHNLRVLLNDLENIWMEAINREDILKRVKEENKTIDEINTESCLDYVLSVTSSVGSKTQVINLEKDEQNVINLQLNYKITDFTLKMKFTLIAQDSSMFFSEFTIPLIHTISYLEKEQEKLTKLIHEKEEEIKEYDLENARITKKHAKTEDRNFYSSVQKDQLLLDIFHKSKEFEDAFLQNYGHGYVANRSDADELTSGSKKKKLKIHKTKTRQRT